MKKTNQTLLIRWNTLFVLNFSFHILNSIRGFHFKSNSLSRKSLHKNLHSTAETQNQMESRLLLDIVVRKSATVLELLTGKDLGIELF